MGFQVFDEHRLDAWVERWTDETYNLQRQIAGSGTLSWRVDAITAFSDDTVAHILDVFLYDGGDYWKMGSVAIPAYTSGVAQSGVDVLAALPAAWAGGLACFYDFQLYGTIREAITLGKSVDTVAVGGTF